MLSILPRIFLYKMYHKLGWPKVLPMNYTISLLYSCNSRCSTCNIYNKKARNLNLEEYEKIFKSIGKTPYWITLSGGEPFLRKDIVKICQKLYEICRPQIINIPTNGILGVWIVSAVKEIALSCPKSNIIINLSIDGIGKTHDSIRNVEGNYEKVIDTFNKLRVMNIPNLSVGIHTVISKYNVEKFSGIATQLIEMKPDSYITEIAENRVELDTMQSDITPDQISYKSAVDFLIHRIKHQKPHGLAKITQSFRVEYYDLVKKIMRDKKQVIPCYAGIASAQISPDGEVWSCCMKADNFGSLRAHDYDFKKIWFSSAMDAERKKIYNKECYCPLANAAYTNMLHHTPTLWRVFKHSFIRWWV